MVLNILHSSKKEGFWICPVREKTSLHISHSKEKEVLVALKKSPLLLSGSPQGYEQRASEVQDLNEKWNIQLIKKGNAVRQNTKLST